jgi:hypothetical protein
MRSSVVVVFHPRYRLPPPGEAQKQKQREAVQRFHQRDHVHGILHRFRRVFSQIILDAVSQRRGKSPRVADELRVQHFCLSISHQTLRGEEEEEEEEVVRWGELFARARV